ncbi:MAG: hypothetical protein NTW86_03570 [Candidatus Sumerlaeota bacterium]|nr:hypothetical protein [Candidatus Sumerlaeota bacterium]
MVINDAEAILQNILLSMRKFQLIEELSLYHVALNISPDLSIGYGRQKFVVVAEPPNNLAHNSHDALIPAGIDHMALALGRLNGDHLSN